MIGIKYTVRHTIQLAFYGTAGLVVGVTGLTLFENQLPLDYRNKIDHLKTQLLCNDIFEEHRKVLNISGQSVDRVEDGTIFRVKGQVQTVNSSQATLVRFRYFQPRPWIDISKSHPQSPWQ